VVQDFCVAVVKASVGGFDLSFVLDACKGGCKGKKVSSTTSDTEIARQGHKQSAVAGDVGAYFDRLLLVSTGMR